MPNSPNTQFNEIDQSQGVLDIPSGLNGVMLKTLRGPIYDDEIMVSVERFNEKYGGIIPGEPGAAQALRALKRGSALKVRRMTHFGDQTDRTSNTALVASSSKLYKVTIGAPFNNTMGLQAVWNGNQINQPWTVDALTTIKAFLAQLNAQVWVVGTQYLAGTTFFVASSSPTDIVFNVTGGTVTTIADYTYTIANPNQYTHSFISIDKGAGGSLGNVNISSLPTFDPAANGGAGNGPAVAAALNALNFVGGGVWTVQWINGNLIIIKATNVPTTTNLAGGDINYRDQTQDNSSYSTNYANQSNLHNLITTGNAVPQVRLAFTDGNNNPLFALAIKYPGANYNNLVASVLAPSNGRADSFNLQIVHKLEPGLSKVFSNLRIPSKTNIANSKYLDAIAKGSELVTPVYYDLTGINGGIPVPEYNQVFGYQGGSDGGALTNLDYIGDPAGKTGFYAFNGADDISTVAILDDVTGLLGVHQAGDAYAFGRKDLKYFMHLGQEGDSEQAVIAIRNALNIDSNYSRIFAGGISWVNTKTGLQEWLPELGDVLGIAAYSEAQYKPYKSFAGKKRGIIIDSLGAGNQWGARGNKVNLDLLANAQINPVVTRDKQTYLLSNLTAQVDYSQLSFGNVRDLVIYMKKSLLPTVEKYQEEGCEPSTWKSLYLDVLPFLDGLKTAKALFDYNWMGDQFATSVEQKDLAINKSADVSLGKYRARLFMWSVVAMQEIAVDIVITSSSVSFEDVASITQ